MSMSNYEKLKDKADRMLEAVKDIDSVLTDTGYSLHFRISNKRTSYSCDVVNKEIVEAIANLLNERKDFLKSESAKIREKLAMIDELLGGHIE